MASKPVKVLSDLLTRKQILKQDSDGNTLFRVTGSLNDGYILTIIPVTASAGIQARLYGTASYALNAATASFALNGGGSGIASVYTSGSISGSGLEASPVFLKDPLIIGTITSSYIYSPQITGTLFGTASYATNAGNINTTNIANAYKRLRYTEIGFFENDGSKIIELPTSSFGGISFTSNSFEYININTFIKEDGRWINDLLSVQIYTSSARIYIELSAPSLDNTNEYKIIAVNEDPSYYIIN